MNENLSAGVKTVNGCPFLTTAGQNIKLLDIVPMEEVEGEMVKGQDGFYELSWYDTKKGGFRFVIWNTEIYTHDELDPQLITDQGGWAEYPETQSYPDDIETLSFGPGQWFFIAPNGDAVKPTITVAGQLYATDATKTTTYLALTPGVKTCVGNPLPVETFLKDIVPMEEVEGEMVKGQDGFYELSWYDTKKGGFRFVIWNTEIYTHDELDPQLITDQGGWAEYPETQSYPDDIETLKWGVGGGFFVTPNGDSVNPQIHFPNPFYPAD